MILRTMDITDIIDMVFGFGCVGTRVSRGFGDGVGRGL